MASLNFLTPDEIQKLRTLLQLPGFEAELRPEWGSHFHGHSEKIHSEINSRLQSGKSRGSSSISHCPGLGGFAITNADPQIQIGFDVEETARVSEAIARRVCVTSEEFLRAPSPASLWAAKEAGFKALRGPRQPSVVSALEIYDWKKAGSQYETASLKHGQFDSSSRIEGVLFKKSSFTFAFFVLRP